MTPIVKKGLEILAYFLLKPVSSFLAKIIERWKRRREIQEKNKLLKENNQKAETKEERNEAARDLIDHFDK